jgi:hypothetical protein
MNEVIEVVDDRQQSLKNVGHISYLLHTIVAVGAVLPTMQASVLILLVAVRHRPLQEGRCGRFLAGVALSLAHPQRAVGRRALPDHRAALGAVPDPRLDRLDRDLDLVPLSHRARLDEPVEQPADAVLSMAHDPSCIFCRIVAGEIPCRKVVEDDEMLVFHDIAPWAPVHVLMIPKAHVATLYDIDASHGPLFGRMVALRPAADAPARRHQWFPDADQHRSGWHAGSTARPHARHGWPRPVAEGLT